MLLSYKSGAIESVVNTLTKEQLDVLMKYIYKGFEIPSEESSKLLLVWHEKVWSSLCYLQSRLTSLCFSRTGVCGRWPWIDRARSDRQEARCLSEVVIPASPPGPDVPHCDTGCGSARPVRSYSVFSSSVDAIENLLHNTTKASCNYRTIFMQLL